MSKELVTKRLPKKSRTRRLYVLCEGNIEHFRILENAILNKVKADNSLNHKQKFNQ